MSGSESDAAQGRQLERLARQVVKNDTQVRSLAASLQRLTEKVAALSPASPAGDGSTGAAGDAGEQSEPLPSWLTTTAFPDAAAMIEALEPWLAAVYLRFPDAELTTCWAWHPHVVEELWWLSQAWYDAYTGPKASWQKVGDWHDRQRPNVVSRLAGSRRLGSTCGLGKHVNCAGDPAPIAPLPDALPHILAA